MSNKKIFSSIICLGLLAPSFISLSCCSTNQKWCTVLLDLDGGTIDGLSDTKILVPKNCTYRTLPTPSKTNFKFDGWMINGELVDWSKSITQDVTVVARWSNQSTYIVSFNLEGGTIEGLNDDKMTVLFGTTYGMLPTPYLLDYHFEGWLLNQALVLPTQIIDKDVELTALWTPIEPSEDLVITGGNISLGGPCLSAGYDMLTWSLTKKGVTVIPDKPMEILPIGDTENIRGISIINGKVYWDSLTNSGPKSFKIKAIYHNQTVLSPNIQFELHRVEFETVQWSSLSMACNALENNEIDESDFCSYFWINNPMISEHNVIEPTSLTSFIGQKRHINVNGKDSTKNRHEIIVIGSQQDVFTSSTTQQDTNAIFTFQFNSLLSDQNGNALSCLYHTTNTPDDDISFFTSKINNNLNGSQATWEGEASQQSVIEMIQTSNSDWSSNIKSVHRSSLCDNTTKITSDVKVFLPTLMNYFSPIGLEQTSINYIPDIYKSTYIEEGTQYQYYKTTIGDQIIASDFAEEQHFEDLLKRDCLGKAKPYWTATRSIENGNGTAFVFNNNTRGFSNYFFDLSSNALSLLPCFCL